MWKKMEANNENPHWVFRTFSHSTSSSIPPVNYTSPSVSTSSIYEVHKAYLYAFKRIHTPMSYCIIFIHDACKNASKLSTNTTKTKHAN